MARMIFVNLPVQNLPRSKSFYEGLGFTFEPRFTNDDAACVVISETIFVMLLTPGHWDKYSPKPSCDTSAALEVLNCLSCESRAEVDDVVRKALAAGGSTYDEPRDHGFMYGHGFRDPDGHVWELAYMDMAAAEAAFAGETANTAPAEI